MSDNTLGLVSKKKVKAQKKVPRLLMSILSGLPAAPLSKRQAQEQKHKEQQALAAYHEYDHFELDPNTSQEEKSNQPK